MDALTAMLGQVRTTGALLGQNVMTEPWAIRFEDMPSLSLFTMLRGEGWLLDAGRDAPLRLTDHHVVLSTQSAPLTITSDPARLIPPVRMRPVADICTDAAGRVIDEEARLGARTCGDRLDDPHALLTGFYRISGTIAERVLAGLPPVLVVPYARRPAVLEVTEQEVTRDQPGQQAVLDRLLELLLIGTLRDWFSRPEAAAPPWYRAMSDPVVGAVLRLMHEQPAASWTVDVLAREAGVARATLARRFTSLLGESPMAYLTRWRLCTAADLLQSGETTVEAIARQVGYSSAYALSAAFHREFGVRPSEHRRRSVVA